MKKLLLINLLLAMLFGVQTVKAQRLDADDFPDPIFREYVSRRTGVPIGSVIPKNNLYDIWAIKCDSMGITSLKGIEYFEELEELQCQGNNITELDLSNNKKLYYLRCQNNNITKLDLSNNPDLWYVECCNNQITNLNLTGLTKLKILDCSRNNLTTLNLTSCSKLQKLSCYLNGLTSLNVSQNPQLESLLCSSNSLSNGLNVSNNTSLRRIDCDHCLLPSLDVSKLSQLDSLLCYNNNLTTLNVSNNKDLTLLYCGNNNLSSLDVSMLTILNKLSCGNNQLTSLKLNSALTDLRCEQNSLPSLDVSKNWRLELLNAADNNLREINLSNNTYLKTLDIKNNKLLSLFLEENLELKWLDCSNNLLSILDLYENTNLIDVWAGGNRLLSVRGVDRLHITYYNVHFGNQESTRRFYLVDYKSSLTNDKAWALPYSSDLYRVLNFKVDGVSKTPVVYDGWLIVSTDLKKIPQEVTYNYYIASGAEEMGVKVNYDVVDYGISIAGKQLTSLDMYNIPGVTKGKVHIEDETSGLGWANELTLVMEDSQIELSEGEIYYELGHQQNLTIKVVGDCAIIKTKGTNPALNLDLFTNTYFTGGGTLNIATIQGCAIAMNDYAHIVLQDGTTLIADSYSRECVHLEGSERFEILGGSTLCLHTNENPDPTFWLPDSFTMDNGIALRYPVGGYVNNGCVCYSDGTRVVGDWVVFGPAGATPPAESMAVAVGIDSPTSAPIHNEGEIYNLSGQRLNKMQKGINIVGGKKLLVK